MSAVNHHTNGLLISFEGIDGCGKSTQMALAEKHLKDRGRAVVTLREPGSTKVAEKIREILLDRGVQMSDVTELLLYEAARADVTHKEILPALSSGSTVLTDRFFDSTTAYQGYGRQLDIDMVKRLHKVAVGELEPDLTLLFDIEVEQALARRGKAPDRLEAQPREFFARVRRGFLSIARQQEKRVKIIDASRSIEEVFDDVASAIDNLLDQP